MELGMKPMSISLFIHSLLRLVGLKILHPLRDEIWADTERRLGWQKMPSENEPGYKIHHFYNLLGTASASCSVKGTLHTT